MNNFNFYVLGNHSPNFRLFGRYKCTCYMLNGFDKKIFLDFGAGIFFRFLNIIRKEKINIDDIVIIISHNHLDHNFSLILLSFYLYVSNLFHKGNKKIKVILPNNNFMYRYVKRFKSVFDVEVLKKDTKININNCEFSFCATVHKGGSYATKIKHENNTFVYTSDIARVSKTLADFVKGADVVMVDAGYPDKKLDSFTEYHGMTEDIMKDLNKCDIKKILATHLRICYKLDDYLEKFPKEANIKMVKEKNTYKLFK